MTAYTGDRRFNPQQGQFRVALQPILDGGDLCFVNYELLLWLTRMVTNIELLSSVTYSTSLSFG